jgi:Asp/Glu/hydantoin racemase
LSYVDRSTALLIGYDRITGFDRADSVPSFVERYRDEQAYAVVDQLRRATTMDRPGILLVGWGNSRSARTDMIQVAADVRDPDTDGNLVVTIAEPGIALVSNRIQLPRLLRGAAEARRIIVEMRDGRRLAVVDLRTQLPPPNGNTVTLTLVPAGRPQPELPA